MRLPGIKINTSPTDFAPIEPEQLAKFDGERWALFGEMYDAGKQSRNRAGSHTGSPPALSRYRPRAEA